MWRCKQVAHQVAETRGPGLVKVVLSWMPRWRFGFDQCSLIPYPAWLSCTIYFCLSVFCYLPLPLSTVLSTCIVPQILAGCSGGAESRASEQSSSARFPLSALRLTL